ncbi:MAG: hypothetical protein O2800_00620 [Planctomycetota bacterium]|nr:hypothetical protein [Planctomycetota bacterium]
MRIPTTFVASAALCLCSTTLCLGVDGLQRKSGLPLPDLTPTELQLFETGKLLFATPPTIEQGLGPIFNKSNCQSCHTIPTGGWGSITVTHFGLENKGEFMLYPGEVQSLKQAESINLLCAEETPADATVHATRVTNSSLAFGIVDAITNSDIASHEDPLDANLDGVSGRVHWVSLLEDPTGPLRAGRFGWKAQVGSVLTFSGDAARNEMGFTNRLVPDENPPNGDYALLAQCDVAPDPEDVPDAAGFAFIDRVTHFQRYLGMPPQTPKSGMTGEALFNQVGCSKCHIRDWNTPNDSALEVALRGKSAKIYSDFLVHDMGTLADGIQQGDATEFEFRTPVLWNLVQRDPMLHDGSALGGTFANRVTLVISRHGPFGEGANSSAAFAALNSTQKSQLIGFLASLGRLEFDSDFTGFIDLVDLLAFDSCFGLTTTADDACAVHDIDQNGTIDLVDLGWFEQAYIGPNNDCNNNGVADIRDIVLGTSVDLNLDGVPDDCGSCPADINNSGTVDGMDLALLLGNWGSAAGDITGDGLADGMDLAIVLGSWGTCS